MFGKVSIRIYTALVCCLWHATITVALSPMCTCEHIDRAQMVVLGSSAFVSNPNRPTSRAQQLIQHPHPSDASSSQSLRAF